MKHADMLCVPARGIAASVRLLRRQRLRNISSVSNRSIGGKDPASGLLGDDGADFFAHHDAEDVFRVLQREDEHRDVDRKAHV